MNPAYASVTVWWLDITDHPGLAERPHIRTLLSPAEREWSDRLRRPDSRARFALARALVRLTVAARLQRAPATVAIAHRCRSCGSVEHGKPDLVGPGPAFSVTHAGDWVGVALCDRFPVGLDLEPLTPAREDWDGVARLMLGPAEYAQFEQSPPDLRNDAALRWWTRKEAVLKASGWGLAISPDLVHVSAPDQTPALLAWPDAYALGGGSVQLRDLSPSEETVGCVAAVGDKPIVVEERDGRDLLRG